MKRILFLVVVITLGSQMLLAAGDTVSQKQERAVIPSLAKIDQLQVPSRPVADEVCWWSPSGKTCPNFPSQSECEGYCNDHQDECGTTSCYQGCGTAYPACLSDKSLTNP